MNDWWIIIIPAAIIQIVLLIAALIRLSRLTVTEVAGLQKPAWLAIIVFMNIIGPIVFLVMSRRAEAAPEPATTPMHSPGETIAGLYGRDATTEDTTLPGMDGEQGRTREKP